MFVQFSLTIPLRMSSKVSEEK